MTKTMTKTIDADDVEGLESLELTLQQDLLIATRVSQYFINHGHIECSVVTDAFYEGGMEDMLAAALNNGREVHNLSRNAFAAAGAMVLFGKAESEWQKKKRQRNATRRIRLMSPQTMRATRQRRDRALADLANLTGEAREKLIELQFAGKEPTKLEVDTAIERLNPKPMKKVA